MKVLVYQMGKVGSASVHQSLLAHGGGVDVEHVHEVDPDYVRNVRCAGPESAEYRRCARLRRLMLGSDPLKVITLVREPLARNVSLLWEQYGAELAANPKRARELWGRLRRDEVLTWFDRELKQSTGIDVYLSPFDKEIGWSVIRYGERRVLILKCEASDAEKEAAISEFLDLDGFVLNRHNVNGLPEYTKFCESFKVTRDYADRMATARYTRHFYTDVEIDVMRERWTER